ncbi:MAG: PEP-CTERM sorting domain-containing protein [Roseateles sp.]|uniref:PEP-CTERM sorting domain-containing protein n=1 Tax=Roseateles sp. TaxID=1971397 RepID=UPI0040366311
MPARATLLLASPLAFLKVAVLTGALSASQPAAAIDSQLLVNMNVHATSFMPPGAGEQRLVPTLDLRDDPRLAQMQRMHEIASFAGGHGIGRFEGHVGLLRAFASASFPYCCDLAGRRVNHGYAGASVQGRFYDSIPVTGAGLAPGTPVSYTVNFSISGHLSSPGFEIGGFLSAYGVAEVRLRDMSSFAEVSKSWDASRDAPAIFSLRLDTFVGRTISLSGMLAVGASVSDYAVLARYAEADFGHSAGYQLIPSVAGLNTVGASGHDFATPVPEPAAGLLMLAGLAVLVRRRQLQPCSPRPSSKSGASSAPPTASGATACR